MAISVDFPEPERPQIATCLPGGIEMLMSFSTFGASLLPIHYDLVNEYHLFLRHGTHRKDADTC